MRKNVQRLTSEGLRRTIRVEVRRLRESENEFAASDQFKARSDQDVVGQMVDVFRAGNPYDPGDPVMEETGEQAWNDQLDRACDELYDQLTEVVTDVHERLVNGEFYSERG
jgi:hypothetical protein